MSLVGKSARETAHFSSGRSTRAVISPFTYILFSFQNRAFALEIIDCQIRNEPQNRAFASEMIGFILSTSVVRFFGERKCEFRFESFASAKVFYIDFKAIHL